MAGQVYFVAQINCLDQLVWNGKEGVCLVSVDEKIAALMGGLVKRVLDSSRRALQEVGPMPASDSSRLELELYDPSNPAHLKEKRAIIQFEQLVAGQFAQAFAMNRMYEAVLAQHADSSRWYAVPIDSCRIGKIFNEIPDGASPIFNY